MITSPCVAILHGARRNRDRNLKHRYPVDVIYRDVKGKVPLSQPVTSFFRKKEFKIPESRACLVTATLRAWALS